MSGDVQGKQGSQILYFDQKKVNNDRNTIFRMLFRQVPGVCGSLHVDRHYQRNRESQLSLVNLAYSCDDVLFVHSVDFVDLKLKLTKINGGKFFAVKIEDE